MPSKHTTKEIWDRFTGWIENKSDLATCGVFFHSKTWLEFFHGCFVFGSSSFSSFATILRGFSDMHGMTIICFSPRFLRSHIPEKGKANLAQNTGVGRLPLIFAGSSFDHSHTTRGHMVGFYDTQRLWIEDYFASVGSTFLSTFSIFAMGFMVCSIKDGNLLQDSLTLSCCITSNSRITFNGERE